MISNLGDIVDTQCGFKAFKSDIIPLIIKDLIEKKFAFDIELLLRTQLYQEGAMAKVPIAWIDSEEASTTTDLQPYLPMLQSIAKMNRRYFSEDAESEEFASFIASLDEEGFKRILDDIPADILRREPDEFTAYDGVRVEEFKRVLSS